MNKRLLALLLLAAMLLCFCCGCKSPDADRDPPAQDAAPSVPNDASPTLNGAALESFVIVYDRLAKSDAEHLATQIKLSLDVALPLVEESAYTGEKNAILLGAFGYNSFGGRRFAVRALQSGDVKQIYLHADSSGMAERVVAHFLQNYLKRTMTVDETDQCYAWRDTDYASGLSLRAQTRTALCDGVTYIEQTYTNADSKGVKAYVTVISPHLVPYLKVAAPPTGEVATVSAQVRAANALLGVNAGFFDIHKTNLPTGVCIVDGAVQNPPSTTVKNTNLWFGITATGEAVIANASAYYSSYEGNLPFAVGGNKLIISNSKLGDATSALEPRTAVGVCADGSVAIVCVDGRSTRSAGATYADVAQIFMELELGVTNALNLDGGGSTTVVIREGEDYSVKNLPSDGKERAVQSVLLLSLPAAP